MIGFGILLMLALFGCVFGGLYLSLVGQREVRARRLDRETKARVQFPAHKNMDFLREHYLSGTPVRESGVMPDDRIYVTKGEFIVSHAVAKRLRDTLGPAPTPPKPLWQRWALKTWQRLTKPYRRS